MEKIPTAEEFLMKVEIVNTLDDKQTYLNNVKNHMIEFAKLHVDEALKAASATDIISGRSYKHRAEHDKDSILKSYPLENIK
jgi:hypothetical protein